MTNFPQELGPLGLQRCGTVTVKEGRWKLRRVPALQGLQDWGVRCTGRLSPFGTVTYSWRQLGAPRTAVKFAWAYPDEDVIALDERTRKHLEPGPEVDLVCLGGFIFFGADESPLAGLSVSSRPTQWEDGWTSGANFEGPFSWPGARTAPLHAQDRFQAVSIKQLRDKGARWFCWLLPGEDIGGGLICPDGGFVYLFSETPGCSSPSDCYFRVSPAAPRVAGALQRFDLVDHNAGTQVVPRLKYNQLTLFAVPQMRELAEEMLATAPGLFLRGEMTYGSFPDRTPNLWVNPHHVNGYDVVLLVNYDVLSGGADWLHNLGLIYEIPRYGARSLTVVLPFYPVGTMERVSTEGEIPTAATFARLLSATPLTSQGPARFVFFDIHALQNRFYFSDRVMPHLTTAIPLLREEIERIEAAGERVAVAFPDEGARKRFGSLFSVTRGGKRLEAYPLVVCSKVRGPGDARTLLIREGREAVPGRHIVIVDDLVQSGGTMLGCKDLLFESGAAKVTGFVTHGVFPRDSWKRFSREGTPEGSRPFTHFLITDSIPNTANKVRGVEPFRVLCLAPRLIDLLGGVEPERPHARTQTADEIRPTPHASPQPAHRSRL
eukprot:Hpha_TRINITY_DN14869_c1_g2::TRINITY_DN14869_c1_g2_i1::g.169546::m.169546